MIRFLEKNWILILCFLGSFIRLLYGYFYEPWNQAPDQLAWELILDEGRFRYDHLIHYPHEGGSIVVSIFSQFINPFTEFSALTISAVSFDFIIRFSQIKIANQIFNLQIAIAFGIWTIFATPTLIPWGTVNFGLHYIAGIFPFVLLVLLHQNKDTVQHYFFCGLFLGGALWFSYSNVVLIPVFILYQIITKVTIQKWLYSVLAISIVLLIHLLVRLYCDPGFHLHETGLASIRDADFSIQNINVLSRVSFIPEAISNAPLSNLFAKTVELLYYILMAISVIGFTQALAKHSFDKSTYAIPLTFIFFLTLYFFSPFFNSQDLSNYVSLRHLTYIIPLIALFVIAGLSSLKFKPVFLTVFLLLGIYRSAQLFTTQKSFEMDLTNKASGWVLANKFGHNPKTIQSIVDRHPQKRRLLIQGIGWGISNALLPDVHKNSDESDTNHRVEQLVRLILKYPESYQKDLFRGVMFSFSNQVTSGLNNDVRIKLEDAIYERLMLETKKD